MSTQLQLLDDITQYLVTAGAAVPVIFSLISMIALAFKGITGEGPTLVELADLIERKLPDNEAKMKAEIARLRVIVNGETT